MNLPPSAPSPSSPLPPVGLKPSEPREVAGTFLRPLDRTRDKFLVQSVLVLEGREESLDRLVSAGLLHC